MASSRDAAVVPGSKRQKVDDRFQLREMVALQHTTKTSIVDALRVLKKAVLLNDCVTKRDLKKAAEHHASQTTPYGKVVERLELDALYWASNEQVRMISHLLDQAHIEARKRFGKSTHTYHDEHGNPHVSPYPVAIQK